MRNRRRVVIVGADAALFAFLLVVCVGCERRAGDAESPSGKAGPKGSVVAGAPSEGAPKRPAPDIAYAVVAPEISEESPVVNRRLPTAAGRSAFLRADTLYAAAEDLVPILKPGARVSLSNGAVIVDGRELPVNGLEQNGAVYVPVKAFAREFGAYTMINEVDGSATIWPQEALVYWNKNGPGNAPVLINAASEGLIPPRSRSTQP
ncbi:MAG TPA: hypothetical protein VK544_10260 [Gemmatimonadaceae bacterium]|nr:hypothetical protein [Gemmatimonadaceae bacterium]